MKPNTIFITALLSIILDLTLTYFAIGYNFDLESMPVTRYLLVHVGYIGTIGIELAGISVIKMVYPERFLPLLFGAVIVSRVFAICVSTILIMMG
jgi:hypothetical protein